MRTTILATVLVLSLLCSLVQIVRLRQFRSGRALMPSSRKAFRLMRRSFLAVWIAGISVLSLAFEWRVLTFGLCMVGGFLLAQALQWLTQASGLMAFVEAGEEAIAARRAAIREAGDNAGNLFVVRSNGKEYLPKIVPERPDWDALLQFRRERVRSSAS